MKPVKSNRLSQHNTSESRKSKRFHQIRHKSKFKASFPPRKIDYPINKSFINNLTSSAHQGQKILKIYVNGKLTVKSSHHIERKIIIMKETEISTISHCKIIHKISAIFRFLHYIDHKKAA